MAPRPAPLRGHRSNTRARCGCAETATIRPDERTGTPRSVVAEGSPSDRCGANAPAHVPGWLPAPVVLAGPRSPGAGGWSVAGCRPPSAPPPANTGPAPGRPAVPAPELAGPGP